MYSKQAQQQKAKIMLIRVCLWLLPYFSNLIMLNKIGSPKIIPTIAIERQIIFSGLFSVM
jgi:hypothetical protein